MKKIMLMAALMLASTGAFAQHAVGSLTLQPKIGLNIANLSGDNADGDARCGLAVGAELEYQISDMFSIAGAALYSMQGTKGDNSTMKVDYINIPVVVNAYLFQNFAVKLGCQLGINVNSEFKVSNYTADVDAKSIDFSIPIGVSYEYQNFVLDARYNWGLTDVFENVDAKNSVFQITLGYKFDL